MRWLLLIIIVLTACSSYNDTNTTSASPTTSAKDTKTVVSKEGSGESEMEFASTPQKPTAFSKEEEQYLLKLARSALDGSQPPAKPTSTVLDENLGAFVTLKEHDNLRGCIGFIIGQGPLWREIPVLAKKAAYEDPRFMPVRTEEVPELNIEISIMTKLWQMTSPEEIVVGEHGLLMIFGNCSGILLPQVAPEFGVDRYGFLEMVSQKAGLPSNTWKDPRAKIYLFAATVFGEN